MTDPNVQEGKVPFSVSGLDKPCNTWYKTFGDLRSGKNPLIVLHGGPGASHDYLLPLTDLTAHYAIPVIFYDQLGNGHSTHLPEKNGDAAFWTEALFLAELDNLIDALGLRAKGFDILGQSWGGMLGAAYAALRPKGLRKLVISNSPASVETWLQALDVLRKKLPEDVQTVIERCERENDFESEAYEAAVEVFYKRHMSLARPWKPKELVLAEECLKADPTVYGTMYGPSELTVLGSLKHWTCIPSLHAITAPTLLLNGAEDEAQDVCVQPFFEGIEKVKWVVIEGAAHLSHVDKRERYMELVGDFLNG